MLFSRWNQVSMLQSQLQNTCVRQRSQRSFHCKSTAVMLSTSRPTQSHSRTKPVFSTTKRIGQSSGTDMSRSLIEKPLSKYRSWRERPNEEHLKERSRRVESALLHELIERIDVYEAEGTGKNRTQRIVIHYRFISDISKYPAVAESKITQHKPVRA